MSILKGDNLKDDDIVEFREKMITWRELKDYFRRDDATVQLSLSKEIVTMKELRRRKGLNQSK